MPADPEELLSLSVEVSGSIADVEAAGELDAHTAPLLAERVAKVIGDGATSIRLNMAGIGFIDSSGLRVLISIQQDAVERGGGLELRSTSATTQRLLDITGLSEQLSGTV